MDPFVPLVSENDYTILFTVITHMCSTIHFGYLEYTLMLLLYLQGYFRDIIFFLTEMIAVFLHQCHIMWIL